MYAILLNVFVRFVRDFYFTSNRGLIVVKCYSHGTLISKCARHIPRLSVFGAMQTAQCEWRNASGATQMANPNPNPLALRRIQIAILHRPIWQI